MENNELEKKDQIEYEEVQKDTEQMVLLATNTTRPTRETYVELNKVSMPNTLLVGIVMGLIIILLGFVIDHFKFGPLSITLCILGALYPLILLLLSKRAINKSVNKNIEIMKDIVLTYRFYETCFDMSSASSSQNSNIKVDYSTLIKVIETENSLFLYIMPQQAYIVSKNGFEVQNIDALRNTLKAHVASYKYKNGGGK